MEDNLKKTEEKVTETFEKMSETTDNVVEEKVIVEGGNKEKEEKEETKSETTPPVEGNKEKEEEEKTKSETTPPVEGNKTIVELEAKIEKPVVEGGDVTEDNVVETVMPLLKSSHMYSHLNCGRLIRDEVTPDTLRAFLKEFVAYGFGSATDIMLINILKQI